MRVFDLFEYVQQRVVDEEPRQHPVFKCALRDNFVLARYLPRTALREPGTPDWTSSVGGIALGPGGRKQERAVVPALRHAVRTGAIASVISLFIVGRAIGPAAALLGGLFVASLLVVLLALSRPVAGNTRLEGLTGVIARAFSLAAVLAAVLLVDPSSSSSPRLCRACWQTAAHRAKGQQPALRRRRPKGAMQLVR